jgi:TonB-dependent starch-binding outer membrane protein SusC
MHSWRKSVWLVPGVLALFASAAAAQQAAYTISGRALDETSRQPVPGVTVLIRGTQFGSMTNSEGRFTISARLVPGAYTLETRMIGRERLTRSISLGGDRTIDAGDFLLRSVALSLEEVVVTGTAAPTARRAIGNAVATVEGPTINEAPATTIDQALQGKISGAVIQSNTGTPGGGVSVRLRGTSSIVAGAEPLYIVDGVIVDNNADQQINFGYRSNPSNRLADLDPNDIERIEILKGAAAAALYGSRANNGVVQIFTKRGRAGATQFVAETRFTNAKVPKYIDFALTPKDVAGAPVVRYDPQPLIFRSPWSNDSHVALSGGSDDTQFYLSGNWTNEKGIMIGSDHEKLNVRLNLDQRVKSWLSLGAGANYVSSRTNLVINGEQGFGGLLTAVVFTPTTLNIVQRDPQTGLLVNTLTGPFPNPLLVVENWETPQENFRFVGSFNARATPIENVRLDYRLGYDRYELETGLSIPRGDPNALLGSATSANRRNMLINNDLVGTVDYGMGDALRMSTSAGMNQTYQRLDQFNLGASDLTPFTTLVRGAVPSASEARIETVTLGFFGQQQLSFANRLYLTGALRLDASSTFGADERWQSYPKLSGSWVVDEEPFWRSMPGWFSAFRLRSALGYAGNQPPLSEAYTRVPRFAALTNINRTGLVPQGTPGNPNLKPERQREWEAGFDASFMNDRLATVVTYYDKYTFDLLLSRPFTPSAGYSSVLDNIGEMSNKGWEFELNTVNLQQADFGWKSRFIYSRNDNKVEKLNTAAFVTGYTNLVAEGLPLGVHFMPAYLRDASGNIQTDSLGARLAGACTPPACPIATPNRRVVGSPWPDYSASLLNEFRFRNFTSSILFDGSFGAKLWNQTARIMDIFAAGPNYDRRLRGELSAPQLSRYTSIWENYLEDASYIKLRDFRVGYSTRAPWLRAVGASSAQFEIVGRNLITWTDYSGYDPEINMFGLSTVERGTDFAVYPNPRTIGFSVRVSY